MSDDLPELYTAPASPESVMVLPRARRKDPPEDQPITILIAAKTVGGSYTIPPSPPVEDRTAKPEPETAQPDRGKPRRIRMPRTWNLGDSRNPGGETPADEAAAEPGAAPVASTVPTRAGDGLGEGDRKPQNQRPEPLDEAAEYLGDERSWGNRAWDNGRYYYAIHFGEESGWNWTRIRWAWRWVAPAGIGWGFSVLHGTTNFLNWFHTPDIRFSMGAALVVAGGWIVWKTRRFRPVFAWLTRIPLSTCTAAWLSLPVTAPTLAAFAAAGLHTAVDVINTLAHR